MEVGGARVLRSDGSRGGGDVGMHPPTDIQQFLPVKSVNCHYYCVQPEAISLTQNAYKRLATGRARRGDTTVLTRSSSWI